MSTAKITMVFEYTSNVGRPNWTGGGKTGGWTESLFFDGSPTAAVAKARSPGGLFASRAALLPKGAVIKGFRVQDVTAPTPGPARSFEDPYPSSVGYDSDVPWNAVLLKLRSDANRNVRNYYVQCIPDGMSDYGSYVPTTGYKDAMGLFLFALRDWQYGGRDLTVPKKVITTVSDVGLFTTLLDHGFSEDDLVHISKVKNAVGQYHAVSARVVSRPTTKTFTLTSWLHGAGTGGKAWKVTTAYSTVWDSTSTVSRLVRKNIGRPFDLYRGRVSVR